MYEHLTEVGRASSSARSVSLVLDHLEFRFNTIGKGIM